MFFQVVILILVLTFEGQVYAAKIFGGHEAVPHSRPYMVLLEEHMKDGTKQHCGGFLLNENFVMTAAHCQAESYTVLLGLHNFHNQTNIQRISVQEKFPHKDFDKEELINDLMLLRLKSKAQFNEHVRPIDLAGEDDGSLPKSCIVSGWGRSKKSSNYMSPTLLEVNVTLTENKECAMRKLYCSEGETGPGSGDSGGPLVCEDGKVYGVVSHTYNKTQPLLYCYTKIPTNKSWIQYLMKTKT